MDYEDLIQVKICRNHGESWERGEYFKHNIVMLYHELTELIMMKQGMSYLETHDQTDKIYNYLEELEKW